MKTEMKTEMKTTAMHAVVGGNSKDEARKNAQRARLFGVAKLARGGTVKCDGGRNCGECGGVAPH